MRPELPNQEALERGDLVYKVVGKRVQDHVQGGDQYYGREKLGIVDSDHDRAQNCHHQPVYAAGEVGTADRLPPRALHQGELDPGDKVYIARPLPVP